jgi:murein DD-endopeptidase MepM/ murein hydrolase activator NlpD
MKFWPVPQSNNRIIPEPEQPGSFWENRGDRHHAGVDMYAPAFSDVIAIEDGEVLEVSEFTSPDKIPYWNVTYAILVKNDDGLLLRYAELYDAVVSPGDKIQAGCLLGHVGLVLNLDKINETSPRYIQKLKEKGAPSMLHFEMHQELPDITIKYLGGNFFVEKKPQGLIDPTNYLKFIIQEKPDK